MAEDWKYGDVVRRAITRNPAYYSRIMYVGPAHLRARTVYDTTRFIGVQLSEPPPLAAGSWINPPPVGAIRRVLRRDLFEKEPDA